MKQDMEKTRKKRLIIEILIGVYFIAQIALGFYLFFSTNYFGEDQKFNEFIKAFGFVLLASSFRYFIRLGFNEEIDIPKWAKVLFVLFGIMLEVLADIAYFKYFNPAATYKETYKENEVEYLNVGAVLLPIILLGLQSWKLIRSLFFKSAETGSSSTESKTYNKSHSSDEYQSSNYDDDYWAQDGIGNTYDYDGAVTGRITEDGEHLSASTDADGTVHYYDSDGNETDENGFHFY